MTRQRYFDADSFETFLGAAQANQDLWKSIARRASVPDEIAARVRAVQGRWHLLVLLEDWCGDAVNTVPLVAALAETSPKLDLRVLRRDENLDLMDAHLTDGSRSIPVMILLDEDFEEAAWWGPRPRELQRWVRSEGAELPKEERYREVRRWYARDGGDTTLEEITRMIEQAGRVQRTA